MNIEEAKTAINGISKKVDKVSEKVRSPGIGWEIGAYLVRIVSAIGPAIVVMYNNNSWLKASLGLTATLVIFALFIIFKELMKKASAYAPGTIPFALFVIIALFFQYTAKSLLLVGISGLIGSVLAIPLHVKYLSYKNDSKSPELAALEAIAAKLK